mgnify:CR=1 FL=1
MTARLARRIVHLRIDDMSLVTNGSRIPVLQQDGTRAASQHRA